MSKVNINSIIEELNSLYAKDKSGSIIRNGVTPATTASSAIKLPDDSPLSRIIGSPAFPFDKIIQIAGEPDCGKSTWASELAVSAQRDDCSVILWDAEKKFDEIRFQAMGGDPKELAIVETNEILRGGERVRKLIHRIKGASKTAKILVIWDSVGGSQSRSHAERDLDDEKHAQPGQDAKENGSVMKTLVALMNKYPDSIAVYLVNQVYSKIGFMQKGNAHPGGKKIEFHSSMIIELKRIKVLTKTVNKTKVKYGIVSRATVKKNHLGRGATSVHQLDFQVTADGTSTVDTITFEDDDE